MKKIIIIFLFISALLNLFSQSDEAILKKIEDRIDSFYDFKGLTYDLSISTSSSRVNLEMSGLALFKDFDESIILNKISIKR